MVEHSEHGSEACHVCALREIERLRAEVKRLDDGWTDCVWHLQSAHKAMGVWKPALVAAEADRDRLRAENASLIRAAEVDAEDGSAWNCHCTLALVPGSMARATPSSR